MYLRVMRFVQIIGVNCLFFLCRREEKKKHDEKIKAYLILNDNRHRKLQIFEFGSIERDREEKIIEKIHVC